MSNCTASADSAADKWDWLHGAIPSTALASFEKRVSKRKNWFKDKSSVITPVIADKWNALTEYKGTPHEKSI